MIVHCLFEQSGTFKNEFKKLGFEAYDYDIDNQFRKTDYQIDLFAEIKKASKRENSIFDNFTSADLIIAFFPCIRFSKNILLSFRGDTPQMKSLSTSNKLINSKRLNLEQSDFYNLFCDLFLICIDRNLRMIVENPYGDSYLDRHFPIRPSVIDLDRTIMGDTFKKPTSYWFVNCSPRNNTIKKEFIFGNFKSRENKTINHISGGMERSLISSKYAENFIKKYILESEVMPNDKKVTNP